MSKGFIPTFAIYKDGEDVTARFQDRATSIIVELSSGAGEQDHVEIVLDDREWLIATPRAKDRLTVYLGYEEVGLAYMGSFEINSVQFSFPPRSISVRGTAASSLNDLKSQMVKGFADQTVEQILAEAGSKIGMKVDVHPSIADQKIPFLNNTASYAHLISRLEQHYGAVAKINDGRLSLTPRGSGKSVSDLAQPTFVLRAESFADLQVLVESRGETASTKARYFDRTTNERVFVESKSKLTDLDTTSTHTIQELFNSKEEAQAAADAAQGQLDRSTGRISATLAEGDPWVRDQQRIVVTGIRDGINGSFLVDLVRHVFTKNGALRTSFTGNAGIDGLAEEYSASTGNNPAFIVLPAGNVFGQVLLKMTGTELPQPFSSVPSLVGQPLPFITN